MDALQGFAAFDQILMMVLLGALGLGLRKAGILSDGLIAGLSRLLLTVAQPALMIVSTQRAHDARAVADYLMVMGVAAGAMMACMALVYALTAKLNKLSRPVVASAAALPNVGYMGIPIAQAVFGEAGVFYLSAYIIAFNLAQWTVGQALFTGVRLKALKNLANPIFIAAVAGTLLFILDVRLPDVVVSGCQQLSNINTPLAMLVLGARMETLRPGHLLDGRMWLAVSVKLLALPLLLLLCVKGLGASFAAGVLVLGSAMPSGANIQLQAEACNADTGLAARCITVSTLISVATIPLILWLMN